MKKLIPLIIILAFFFPSYVMADTFYVDQDGYGDADGSTYAKRASVAYHNAGTGNFANLDDDTVYLCDQIDSQVSPPDSGTSGHVVTYRGDYAGHAADLRGLPYGIYLNSDDYITIDSIAFNKLDLNDSDSLRIVDCDYITVKDCTFENIGLITGTGSREHGIALITTESGGGTTNITIQDNEISGGYDSCIYLRNHDVGSSPDDSHDTITIDGNELHECRGNAINFRWSNGTEDHGKPWSILHFIGGRYPRNMVYTDNYIHDTNVCGIVDVSGGGTNIIRGNYLYNIGSGGTAAEVIPNALQLSRSRNMIIEHNVIDTVTACDGCGDGHCIILDYAVRNSFRQIPNNYCDGVVIRHNYLTNARTSGNHNCSGVNLYFAKNCKIYGNVMDANFYGIAGKGTNYDLTDNLNSGNVFYNNTIVNNTKGAAKLYDSFPASTWTNNSFVSNSGQVFLLTYGGSGMGLAEDQDETYNHYHDNTSFSDEDTADATDITGDPLFTAAGSDDYSLTSSSPLKNAGTDLAANFAMGLSPDTTWGNLPNVDTISNDENGSDWEIGAYVYPDDNDPTATLSGTIWADGVLESDIVDGLEGATPVTIKIKLTNSAWESTVGVAQNTATTALINGITGDDTGSYGWDDEVKGDGTNKLTYANVQISSDTETNDTVTITLSTTAHAAYSITEASGSDETVTVTVPDACVTVDSVTFPGDDYFDITEDTAPPPVTLEMSGSATDGVSEAAIVTGSEEIILTVANTDWHDDIGSDCNATDKLIEGITGDDAGANGWDAEVSIAFGNITRDTAKQVTIVLPAAGSYSIDADEDVTIDVHTDCLDDPYLDTDPSFTIENGADPEPPIAMVQSEITFNESGLKSGGMCALGIALANTTWDANCGAGTHAETDNFIDGFVSAQSELYGWNNTVVDYLKANHDHVIQLTPISMLLDIKDNGYVKKY